MGGGRDLFVADVGQNLFEELNLIGRGRNYGWNVREGFHCFSTETPNDPPERCPTHEPNGNALRDPVLEYANSRNPEGGVGVAIVGGHVYRGNMLPQFQGGQYIFGDWSTAFGARNGLVFIARRIGFMRFGAQEIQFPERPGNRLMHYLLGFGQDLRGEVYLATEDLTGPSGLTGRVYQLVPQGQSNSTRLVARLSGANELNAAGVPGAGDLNGTGTAVVLLNGTTGQVCWTLTVQNIEPAFASHIHRGTAVQNGPVVIGFAAPGPFGTSGCTMASPALVSEVIANPAGFYVNVHNTPFPGGAVRGQLTP
jgi:hypothetical protein